MLLATFLEQLTRSLPLFILIVLGYCLIRLFKWPERMSGDLTRLLFRIAIPVMLFRIMAQFYTRPPVDVKLLLAYFGGSIIVFLIARIPLAKILRLNGVEGSIFGLGGIFANVVLLGLPLTTLLLGEEAVPAAALVIAFNALILWSLVTISVEWTLHGSLSFNGMKKTAISVVKNPIVIGVFSGLFVSLFKTPLPPLIDEPAKMVAQMTAPLSLIVLGMGLAQYRVADNIGISLGMTLIKLFMHPLIVLLLALLLNIPLIETKAIVLLSSMAIGINVYLMANQFQALQGAVASSLVISTLFSALTTPLLLAIVEPLFHLLGR